MLAPPSAPDSYAHPNFRSSGSPSRQNCLLLNSVLTTGKEKSALPFFTPVSQIWQTTCFSASGFPRTQPPSFTEEAATAAFVLRRERGAVTTESTEPKILLLVLFQKKFDDLVYKESLS